MAHKQAILLFSIVFALSFTSTAHAHESAKHHAHPKTKASKCKSSKPSLSVKTATTRTKYIRTKSSKDLTQMHGGQGSSVGGLGGGEIGFKVENQYEIAGTGNNVCVKLKRVEVTFYAKPEIHIASNFNRSTCEYNAVMAHEKGHIRILRNFVREYSPKVKKELVKVSRQLDSAIGPIPKSDISRAQDRMQKAFMSKIEQYNEKIMPVLSKRQKAFDNPKEYARVASKCKKWDKKLSKN